jgi:hypothetical protein
MAHQWISGQSVQTANKLVPNVHITANIIEGFTELAHVSVAQQP